MPRSHSLRASLGGLLAAVLLPVALACAALLAYQWREQRAAALDRLQRQARTLQRAVDRELNLDQAVLRALADSSDLDRGDLAAFHTAARKAAAIRPGGWFVLQDRDDWNLVNSAVPFGTPLPNLGQLLARNPVGVWNGRPIPYPDLSFLHAPLETGKPSFSGLIYGPVNHRPTIATLVPVVRGKRIPYVLGLNYGAEFFERLLQIEGAPRDLTTALFDQRGVFIARNIGSERFVGRRGPPPFGSGAGNLPSEGMGEGDSVEGVPFIYAFSRSAVADYVVGAGLPKATVLAPAWHALWLSLAVLLSAAGFGALLAMRLWRRLAIPLGALARQARAPGEPPASVEPSHIDEVDALREALAEAALNERVRREAEREREEARRGLRASEQRLRAIFEDAAVGIVEVDAEDRFVAVNRRFCQMLGYEPDELLGKTIYDITAPEDREVTRELNRRGHENDLRVFDYEKRYLRRDGSPLWVHVTVSVVRDAEGRFLRAVGTAEDVTDRRNALALARAANEKLLEADRRKDEFLSMLSHELRNPLAPIRNSVHVLHRVDPGSPQAARARSVIDRQAEHLTRIVDDLLDVTRIVRGKILLHRDRVDVRDIVARAAEDLHPSIEARHVGLRVDLPEQEVWADADPTRLVQILGNLLSNAAKFTRPGDEIVVSLRDDGGAAVLSVRDTGAGIDPDLLPNLFDAFVQGKRTLARSEGGLGLGLAMVKGLAELHGGSVEARSEGIGCGAEFLVTLPLATAAAASYDLTT